MGATQVRQSRGSRRSKTSTPEKPVIVAEARAAVSQPARAAVHAPVCDKAAVRQCNVALMNQHFSAYLQKEKGWTPAETQALAECMADALGPKLFEPETQSLPGRQSGLDHWKACTSRLGKPGTLMPVMPQTAPAQP